jgi:hypothetical protein
MGIKKQTVQKLVKKNKTRNNKMNGGGVSLNFYDPENPSYGGDWLVLHDIARIRDMKIEGDTVVSVKDGSVITNSGYTKNRQLVSILDYYKQKMEEYFVLCVGVMSLFYDFCKAQENKGTFYIIDNDFTKSLDNLKDPLGKERFNVKWVEILFFPFEKCSKDIMNHILSKPENCVLLSQYIRHMKKISFGFSAKRFKPTYDHRKYPEWDSLSWPKTESRLNNMLDKQFCDDIKNQKFTLTSLEPNSKHYPPFFNPHNTDLNAFTSFTINGISIVNTYHTDLLKFLEKTYGKNPDTSASIDETDASIGKTDASIGKTDASIGKTDASIGKTDERIDETDERIDETTITTLGGKRRKTGGKNTRRNKKQK